MKENLIFWDELLSEGVKAGFTTAGIKADFNLALHAGGSRAQAIENRKRLCRELAVPFSTYTCAEQVHGTVVTPVGPQEKGRGRLSHEDALKKTDALITAEAGILLNIYIADCVPIILFDKATKAGGLCHAGWRGTAGLILTKTVRSMIDSFQSRPEDIRAFIGPSIGGCCYEVGPHVKEELCASFPYENDPFEQMGNSLYLDLKKANEAQLIRAGLKQENIKISPHCTHCSEKSFFSYRKSGDAAGRFSAFFTIL